MRKIYCLSLIAGLTLVLPQLVAAQATPAAEATYNYQLLLNGKALPMAADKPVSYKLPSGEMLQLELRENPVRIFRDAWVSFQTPRTMAVSQTALDGDIQQIMALNPLGSGLIVQEFSSLDPTPVIDLMLQELTKDDVAAGGKRTDKPFSLKLADGKILQGKAAAVTFRKKTALYQIVAWGGASEGVLIVLIENRDGSSDDAANSQFLADITGSLRVIR